MIQALRAGRKLSLFPPGADDDPSLHRWSVDASSFHDQRGFQPQGDESPDGVFRVALYAPGTQHPAKILSPVFPKTDSGQAAMAEAIKAWSDCDLGDLILGIYFDDSVESSRLSTAG